MLQKNYSYRQEVVCFLNFMVFLSDEKKRRKTEKKERNDKKDNSVCIPHTSYISRCTVLYTYLTYLPPSAGLIYSPHSSAFTLLTCMLLLLYSHAHVFDQLYRYQLTVFRPYRFSFSFWVGQIFFIHDVSFSFVTSNSRTIYCKMTQQILPPQK